MARAIYRRGKPYARRARHYIRLAAQPELDRTLDRYEMALIEELRETVTARELECLEHYYVRQLGIADIAGQLEINISTVSRNIRRGEAKLDRLTRLAGRISPVRPGRKA